MVASIETTKRLRQQMARTTFCRDVDADGLAVLSEMVVFIQRLYKYNYSKSTGTMVALGLWLGASQQLLCFMKTTP
jgi:hypothetical protein